MVFFAIYGNNYIDASDVKSKKGISYKCCDPDCKAELSYKKSHKRTLKNLNTNDTYEITVSSHFTHGNNKGNSCLVLNFFNLFDEPDKRFYRKWTEPFIFEAIKNTFNSESKFHILYENIMIHQMERKI